MGAQSGTLRTTASVTISNDKISGPSSDVKVVELEGDSGAWLLKTDEGYLSYSGSSNNISTVASSAATSDISISNGNAEIRPSTATSRILSYNASNPRFCVYGSTQANGSVQIYGILESEKEIADTRLTTSGGSITAGVGAENWTVSGFVFEVQYQGESTWSAVSPTYVVTESVPTSYESIGEYPVHFKVVYKGTDYNVGTSFTANVIDDMTPISEFHTNLDTTKTYTYRGTVIGIEGNSYYLQQDQAGILIYGGTTTPPDGMKVGDLVKLTSQVQNYNGFVIENKGGANTATIIGTGTLPAAPIVTSVSSFNSHPQSTRVTFNGLARNDTGATITWTGTWAYKSSDQSATVKDSSGATITLYVSRYLDSTTANEIISKINTITVDDTFDLFQGVKVVSTSDGSARLSVLSADQITIHTPESDPIQDWIDVYMFMDDSRFDGDGTGLCRDQNFYINAKVGLKAVEEAHPGSIAKFEADAEGDYTDALARYKKWAIACNDASPFDGKEIIADYLRSNTMGISEIDNNSNTISIIAIISVISVLSLGVLLILLKKKKHN